MSKNDDTDYGADDAVLTKQKKPRSEAQIAAFEKARAVKDAKRDERQTAATGQAPDPDKERKKLILQAVKEKLNGESKSKAPPVVDETTEEEVSEEEAPPPPKKVSKKTVVAPPVIKAKKEPKVIYQESSESEEEVVIVKKRKKPKKKTIIIEESETEDEEPAPPKKVATATRDTKSQLNRSMIKVHTAKVEAPPKPIYYFSD